MGVWEPWFYLGAALFPTNLWLHSRREKLARNRALQQMPNLR
jgi:hypothetical protein